MCESTRNISKFEPDTSNSTLNQNLRSTPVSNYTRNNNLGQRPSNSIAEELFNTEFRDDQHFYDLPYQNLDYYHSINRIYN